MFPRTGFSAVSLALAILAVACSANQEKVGTAGQRDSTSGPLDCYGDADCSGAGLRDASCASERHVCVVPTGGSCWNDADCDGVGSCDYVAATAFGVCHVRGADDRGFDDNGVDDNGFDDNGVDRGLDDNGVDARGVDDKSVHACSSSDDCELGESCGTAATCVGTANAHCNWDGDCAGGSFCDWTTGLRDHAGNFVGYCILGDDSHHIRVHF
jgi:hypothetical protein